MKLLTIPLSWIYAAVVGIRHALFNWGILPRREFDIPIVCVGNLAVGGTGKTPHTEFLIEELGKYYNVAVLSRGYKRKTKGFVLANNNSSYKAIGDEPKQIKLKFPYVPVAVCEKRAEGIEMLRKHHPEVNLVILDDAFQHRYVEAWVNILLTDYNNPYYRDHFLPWGRLRDSKSQLKRANVVIVSKCPNHLTPLDYRLVRKSIPLAPYQSLYFTSLCSGAAIPLFPELNPPKLLVGKPITAMSGIANPTEFIRSLRTQHKIAHNFIFPDHHNYTMSDISMMEKALKKLPFDAPIVTTEKDAVKLMNSRKIGQDFLRRLYYIPVKVRFEQEQRENFFNVILQYVRENQKNKITHPQ
ncbi:Tetraacyldisaccharide 4'-kinase [Mucinivorans hirudinis]|uniref:Tetraacyldisaccharide 4'-kinase n=1 Tax=Mucinivorans hirudinis TaxID=1433126 RepID=A0A060R8A7_9BACT|nr:Tetraacyldisaccharide 4'-kinase [Mucinivorans hirudinis]